MIKKIVLRKIPPYFEGEQIIEPKSINFLFGLNGSGKTTISRYLRSLDNPDYNDCSIEWENETIKCAVYNSDYVADNFSESSIPGIFTLGEENIEIKRKIRVLETEIGSLEEKEQKLKCDLTGSPISSGLKDKLITLEENYTDKFWKVKQQFDKEKTSMVHALGGFRGSKDVFKKALLNQYNSNKEVVKDKSELEALCSQLYGSRAELVEFISIPSFKTLLYLESKSILQKIVVGKDDVDIADLIKKLGNDAWFKQGVEYLKNSAGKCPFCQRPLEEDFTNKIAEYFDQSYLLAIQEIKGIQSEYIQASRNLLLQIESVDDKKKEFIKDDNFPLYIERLKNTLETNKHKLDDKMASPNITVQLDSLSNLAENIVGAIKAANEEIAEHNNRINHIKDEREKSTSLVWKYILNVLSEDITTYLNEKECLSKMVSETETAIKEIDVTIDTKKRELYSLEQRLTSIIPTAKGINTLLQNYGFTGFSIKADITKKSYQFIRENGEPAFKSLSEGERNFVTFLYFIYSLKGNTDESGHDDEKVVVVDDPVSSLDNDVLFLVSTLLRDLFKKIYAGEGTIKQLFIFSHNNYFFKEVTYKKGLKKEKTGYWMIVKSNNQSKILAYTENPVNSTYEMLWAEVRKAESNPEDSSTLSLANTMRRIIEYYFNLLGGIDLNQFHLSFPDGERQVFKSLISWVNSGSHSAFDDYSATPALYDSEKYLKVFRDLFEKTKHIAHYNMMMKITAEEN